MLCCSAGSSAPFGRQAWCQLNDDFERKCESPSVPGLSGFLSAPLPVPYLPVRCGAARAEPTQHSLFWAPARVRRSTLRSNELLTDLPRRTVPYRRPGRYFSSPPTWRSVLSRYTCRRWAQGSGRSNRWIGCEDRRSMMYRWLCRPTRKLLSPARSWRFGPEAAQTEHQQVGVGITELLHHAVRPPS